MPKARSERLASVPRHALLRAASMAWVAAALLAAPPVAAQPSASDRALAAELFRAGRALLAEKRIAEACRTFEESMRLDPGGGTLLNLATCHETEGSTATAWTEYREAVAMARRDAREDRVAVAEARLAALEPRLSRLRIVAEPAAETPGLLILRDGTVVPRAAWGVPAPVDPGTHRIEVSAPGFLPWSTTLEIAVQGKTEDVVVPKLEPAAPVAPAPAPVPPAPIPPSPLVGWVAPPAAPSPAPRSDAGPSATLVVGGVLVGIGVVSAGFGIGGGITAFSKRAESDDGCAPECTDAAVVANDEARTAADLSTVSFVIGAAALATGVVLLLVAPRRAGSARARYGLQF